eukprot:TRINITY_DN20181_c0_g1_i1.p1 TRINITY_DN20181_c0_g1~~TRINITY_DN20181_c0_g1_i1.p1  ORF type:complete len:258 (+),score=36.87 TRINITY_DN20181_c0_g1_i1:90-863(+)
MAPLAFGWIIGINVGCGFVSAFLADGACQKIERHFRVRSARRVRRRERRLAKQPQGVAVGGEEETDSDTSSGSEGEDEPWSCDCSRALSMACSVGFVISPIAATWYTYGLPSLVPIPPNASLAVKLRALPRQMFYDLVVYGFPWSVILSASNAAWAKPEWEHVVLRVRHDTCPIFISQAVLWGPADAPTFLLLPMWAVAPFYKVVGGLYLVYVSWVTHRKVHVDGHHHSGDEPGVVKEPGSPVPPEPEADPAERPAA